jgi:hypothetical protein
MTGTGAGRTGLVLLAPDGSEVGTVAQLPGERDQVDVAPAVDAAHRVYFGRGCAGRS